MDITEIRRMPTSTSEMARMAEDIDPKIHESCFKSFHIVEKIKKLCKQGTPTEVILEILEILESPINHDHLGGTDVQ